MLTALQLRVGSSQKPLFKEKANGIYEHALCNAVCFSSEIINQKTRFI